MDKLLVSIVTIAYNSEHTIAQTIESVLGQTYPHIEYYIIDGLSTDGTVALAQSYAPQFAAKDIRYTIISEKDNGIYDAMNKGIALCNGEIIGLINSDDWYEPDAVETVVKTYAKQPFDVYYADLRIHMPDGSSWIKHAKLGKFQTTRHWNHPTTFMRKQVYQQHQYGTEGLHDDWELILRLKKAGRRFVVENKVLANFRFGGASNARSLKMAKMRIGQRYRAYRKNGYSRLYWFECVLMEAAKFIKN